MPILIGEDILYTYRQIAGHFLLSDSMTRHQISSCSILKDSKHWLLLKFMYSKPNLFTWSINPYLKLRTILCAVGFRSCESPFLSRFRTRVSTGWICPTAMSTWRRIPGRTAGKAGQVRLYHLAVYPSKGLVFCSWSGRRMSWYCCSGSAYSARLPTWCVLSSRSTLQAVNRISGIHNYEIKNYFTSSRDSSTIWVEILILPPSK